MATVALIPDLMMQSQVRAAAGDAGVEIHFALNANALVALVESKQARLVLIDLSQQGLDVASVVTPLKQLPAPPFILAFGPHVHKDRLARAAEAGCDLVMSRGQFHAQMSELLNEHGPE